MEVERWRQVDISAASVTVRAYAQGIQTSTSTDRLRRIPHTIFIDEAAQVAFVYIAFRYTAGATEVSAL